MIIFDIEEVTISERLLELAKISVDKSIDFLSFDYEVEISFTTVTNESIRQINKEYRGIDASTDVLSFPMIDWPRPCDFHWLEKAIDSHLNPDNGYLVLGDIVLSMDKVKSQAVEYGHSLEREFVFLIVHSMLHLFGYDHMTENEERSMRQYQNKILETIDYN